MNAVALREEGQRLSLQMDKMGDEFRRALPSHIPHERFQRIAITAINRNPDLLRADRKSLLEACLLSAQDGLLPDGREAALVLFGGKVQYMPMVAGIRKKVYQSGEITSLVARVARENDVFKVIYGDDERIEHEPALFNAGPMIAVYAIATYRDGSKSREVMTIEEIDRIRAISRSGKSGPWRDHYEEMAKKTVIRRLSKSLPLSAEADEVIRRDDRFYDFGQQNSATVHPIAAVRQTSRTIESRLDAFAAEPVDDDTHSAEAASHPSAEANEGAAAAQQPASSESAPADANDASTDSAPIPDNIREATEMGRAGRRSGHGREVPRTLRYTSKQAEADAFLRGWDEENYEISAAEGRHRLTTGEH